MSKAHTKSVHKSLFTSAFTCHLRLAFFFLFAFFFFPYKARLEFLQKILLARVEIDGFVVYVCLYRCN